MCEDKCRPVLKHKEIVDIWRNKMENNHLMGHHDISFEEAKDILHCCDDIPDVSDPEMDSFIIEKGKITQIGGNMLWVGECGYDL